MDWNRLHEASDLTYVCDARGDYGYWLFATAIFLDCTDADMREGKRPYNALVFEVEDDGSFADEVEAYDWLLENGLDDIYVNRTIGAYYSMDNAEQAVIDYCRGIIP